MRKIKINKSKKLSDFLSNLPIGEAPKGKNALKAREYMQKHYKKF